MFSRKSYATAILRSAGAMVAIFVACSANAQQKAPVDTQEKVLRVCQDPKNLPMSDEQERGFENKIAALFAKKLGWKLEHTWSPQRVGFIRNTLRAKIPDTDTYKCDLVTSVSPGFEMGIATKPYFSSTYAMAYVKGKGLDSIRTPQDIHKLDKATLERLKIGIFTGTPAADWLVKNKLTKQMVSYQLQTGDRDQYPGQIIENDLASGKLDIAIAWGPITGYFAKNAHGVPIEVVPFPAEADGIRYGFSIAMGVRHGEQEFRDQINTLIDTNRPAIDAILQEYSVPIVSPAPSSSKAASS
ncbi:ABC transporter substrate-binding protein [Pollutimonas nitritireducens]|uniref:ABC transporter substrate-binding protein n=1 Tax=Pollutimonas nitritireducens TaxID=2045209 RepID=A0A2N4UFW1_9BURK|nr:quinoprotein dehydrogenase-associated putative ABC transporter substrate-binding protein [Pollutimonas nitritireducens]PLC53908.1 ABC transporter substrate-binding protein [Pollutimonas nitritireducens]